MLHLLIAAGEPSKTPFYIAGIALAVWAVILSAIGLSRAEFPGSESGARVVMGISFVLVVIAIAMAVHTSAFVQG